MIDDRDTFALHTKGKGVQRVKRKIKLMMVMMKRKKYVHRKELAGRAML